MSEAVYLLDTSALLTFIENEEGAERVEALLREPSTLIVWVSLLEVMYITERVRGHTEAEQRYALIKALPVTLLWNVGEPIVVAAAAIKASHRLSVADALIAAAALQANAILVHKDPEFEQLANEVRLEALPYKAKSSGKM